MSGDGAAGSGGPAGQLQSYNSMSETHCGSNKVKTLSSAYYDFVIITAIHYGVVSQTGIILFQYSRFFFKNMH